MWLPTKKKKMTANELQEVCTYRQILKLKCMLHYNVCGIIKKIYEKYFSS